jgi:hypothetical protein
MIERSHQEVAMEERMLLPGEEMSFRIPVDLLQEFQREARVVIRFPWVIGIPVPDFLLEQAGVLGKFKDFDVMLVPRELGR